MKTTLKQVFAYILTFVFMICLFMPIITAMVYDNETLFKVALGCFVIVVMIFGSVTFFWVCSILGIKEHEL